MRGYHRYRWHLAQKKYERRMKARRHYLKFTDEMKRTVRRFIIYSQYRSRGIIQDRVDISQRPAVVDEKKRFGDFEIDTMIGRNHKGAIMTTNDRCTHLVLIRRLAGKEAAPLASTAIEALLPYKDKIHTITADNGKEFARPYHSWERGANENTNGLIRQYIPKGTDFSELTDEMLAEIEWKLNHRTRKSLGYRTSLEYCKQLFSFDF